MAEEVSAAEAASQPSGQAPPAAKFSLSASFSTAGRGGSGAKAKKSTNLKEPPDLARGGKGTGDTATSSVANSLKKTKNRKDSADESDDDDDAVPALEPIEYRKKNSSLASATSAHMSKSSSSSKKPKGIPSFTVTGTKLTPELLDDDGGDVDIANSRGPSKRRRSGRRAGDDRDDEAMEVDDDNEDNVIGECLHCNLPPPPRNSASSNGNVATGIQVSCDDCRAFICDACHWCHEFQANHEIRVCDRCDAFYCRACDEMDQCEDCSEVVCGTCSTLMSCKFCGCGLCEDCATACGRCGIVLCARDAKFAVECDTCKMSYCLVCLASGTKDPCVRCGHRPSKRVEQLVHLRLKSIYKAFKQSGAALGGSGSGGSKGSSSAAPSGGSRGARYDESSKPSSGDVSSKSGRTRGSGRYSPTPLSSPDNGSGTGSSGTAGGGRAAAVAALARAERLSSDRTSFTSDQNTGSRSSAPDISMANDVGAVLQAAAAAAAAAAPKSSGGSDYHSGPSPSRPSGRGFSRSSLRDSFSSMDRDHRGGRHSSYYSHRGSSNEDDSTGRNSAEIEAAVAAAEAEADAAAAALLAELDEEKLSSEAATKSKKSKKKKKKEKQQAAAAALAAKDKEEEDRQREGLERALEENKKSGSVDGNDSPLPDADAPSAKSSGGKKKKKLKGGKEGGASVSAADDRDCTKEQKDKATKAESKSGKRKTSNVDEGASREEPHSEKEHDDDEDDIMIASMRSRNRPGDESSDDLDDIEKQLSIFVSDEDVDGIERLLSSLRGVPGRAALRKNAKKALKRIKEEKSNAVALSSSTPVESGTELVGGKATSQKFDGAALIPNDVDEFQSAGVATGGVAANTGGVASQGGSYRPPEPLLKLVSHTHRTTQSSGHRSGTGSTSSQYHAPASARSECVMHMSPSVVGWVIGKGGQRIRELMEESGAKIWIDQDSMGPKDQRIVYVSGQRKSVDSAVRMVKDLVAKAPVGGAGGAFASQPNNVLAGFGPPTNAGAAPSRSNSISLVPKPAQQATIAAEDLATSTNASASLSKPPATVTPASSADQQSFPAGAAASSIPKPGPSLPGPSVGYSTKASVPSQPLKPSAAISHTERSALGPSSIHHAPKDGPTIITTQQTTTPGVDGAAARAVHEMTCEPRFVALLIGRRGWTVKHIQDTSGARIDIDQTVTPRKITLSGEPHNVRTAERMVRDVLNYPHAQLHHHTGPGDGDDPTGLAGPEDLHPDAVAALGLGSKGHPYAYAGGDEGDEGLDGHLQPPPSSTSSLTLTPPSGKIRAPSVSSSLSSTPEPSAGPSLQQQQHPLSIHQDGRALSAPDVTSDAVNPQSAAATLRLSDVGVQMDNQHLQAPLPLQGMQNVPPAIQPVHQQQHEYQHVNFGSAGFQHHVPSIPSSLGPETRSGLQQQQNRVVPFPRSSDAGAVEHSSSLLQHSQDATPSSSKAPSPMMNQYATGPAPLQHLQRQVPPGAGGGAGDPGPSQLPHGVQSHHGMPLGSIGGAENYMYGQNEQASQQQQLFFAQQHRQHSSSLPDGHTFSQGMIDGDFLFGDGSRLAGGTTWGTADDDLRSQQMRGNAVNAIGRSPAPSSSNYHLDTILPLSGDSTGISGAFPDGSVGGVVPEKSALAPSSFGRSLSLPPGLQGENASAKAVGTAPMKDALGGENVNDDSKFINNIFGPSSAGGAEASLFGGFSSMTINDDEAGAGEDFMASSIPGWGASNTGLSGTKASSEHRSGLGGVVLNPATPPYPPSQSR